MSDKKENKVSDEPQTVEEVVGEIPEPTLSPEDLNLSDAAKREALGMPPLEVDIAQQRLDREERDYLASLVALRSLEEPEADASDEEKRDYAIERKRLLGSALLREANVEGARVYLENADTEGNGMPPGGIRPV